jgi:peptide/bleomycin uptake transporter
MNILPMLIIGKDVFLGTITLGVLMQVDNVFSKVNHSFSLFIHNWPTITKLQSVVLRLGEFEQHLDEHQPKQTAIT